MRTILLVVAVAVTAGFGSAGCGGDSGSGAPPRQPLRAAQWHRQANAVCRDVGRRVKRIPPPKAESEIEKFVAAVLPLWKREEDELRALVPPARLAATAGELVTALGYLNAALLEIHISTQRNDGMRRYYAVRKLRAAERGVKLRASKLSLPACATQRIP